MDIKIGKSARNCSSCEQDFEHEQAIYSLVRYSGEEFLREDFCSSCWKEEFAKGSYSSWSSQFYDATIAEQEEPAVYTPLRQAFYEAVEKDIGERNVLAMAYLASQLLRRQKVFRHIKETKDPETEVTLVLFNDRIGNRLIEVRDPNLSHEELNLGSNLLMVRLAELEKPDDETGSELEESEKEEVSVDIPETADKG